MAVPRPPRQPVGDCERALALQQRRVQRFRLGLGERRAAVRFGFGERLVVAVRGAGEGVDGVVELGEIQVRRDRFLRRRHQRLTRIVGGAEDAFVDLPVLFADRVLRVLQQLLDLARVAPDGLGESGEVVRQQIGAGQAHHGRSHRLGEGAAVHERRVVERRVPFEVVVDRVVDATPVLAAVAQVERRDPDVLQERRIVRARAERPDPEIGSAARFIPRFGGACRRNGAELVPLPDGELRFGVLNVPRHVVDELLEGVRARQGEVAPAVGIAVQVGDRLVRELVGVGLDPLGRAEQRGLLAVPGGVDDRAARLPTLLQELAIGARLLEQRRLARDRVLGAVHPGVVVVAPDDPLVRGARARNAGDHVVQRLEAPVGLDPQMHLRRPGANVVRDPESAAPLVGRRRAGERREQRLGVAVRDRQHGNLGNRLRLGGGQALCVLGRAHARRERVARIHRHVHHAAALHAIPGPPRPVGIDIALGVAVIPGVRVDEAADRAVLGRDLGLDAAPRPEVARDHDRALHGDPQPLEPLVVGRHAVVHVNEGGGDVAVHRVRVVGRELLGLLARRRVARQRRLLQLRHELGRRDQLHHALFGRGKQHVERLDLRVEPEALELREDPFGVGLVVRRADVVRSRREVTHVLAQRVGARDRAELGFPLPLDLRRIGRVAAQVAGGGGGRGEDEHAEGGCGDRARSQAHAMDLSVMEVRDEDYSCAARRQRSEITACPAGVGWTPSAAQYCGAARRARSSNTRCNGMNAARACCATRSAAARRSSNSGNQRSSTAPQRSTNGSRTINRTLGSARRVSSSSAAY